MAFIAYRSGSGLVFAAGETAPVFENGRVDFGRGLHLDCTEANTAIAEVELPDDFAEGRYAYMEGQWIEVAADAVENREAGQVPTSVTMRQARLALLAAGLLDDIEAALAAIPDETDRRTAQIEWEYAQDVVRDSPWVQQLAAALGLDAAMLDELFVMAYQR